MGLIPRRTLTVERYDATGYYDTGGVWVEADTGQFEITASVQPLTGREMEMLPEGRKEAQSYKLYTDTLLYTADTSTTNNPDKVQINGVWHEVLIVQDWQNNIINHYKVIVVKL